ncbi:MAG: zinc ribbon domain-containing protein [Methanobacterium sp.]|nr:zinc ribbon domain-containing protein [Methanobacterium sp.]
MVYCRKCGIKNNNNAEYCSKCGVSLKENNSNYYRDRYHRQKNGYHTGEGYFGLPYGNLIGGVIAGIFFILFGTSAFYGFDFWDHIWPIIIVIFGILFIAGAIFNYPRRR